MACHELTSVFWILLFVQYDFQFWAFGCPGRKTKLICAGLKLIASWSEDHSPVKPWRYAAIKPLSYCWKSNLNRMDMIRTTYGEWTNFCRASATGGVRMRKVTPTTLKLKLAFQVPTPCRTWAIERDLNRWTSRQVPDLIQAGRANCLSLRLGPYKLSVLAKQCTWAHAEPRGCLNQLTLRAANWRSVFVPWEGLRPRHFQWFLFVSILASQDISIWCAKPSYATNATAAVFTTCLNPVWN